MLKLIFLLLILSGPHLDIAQIEGAYLSSAGCRQALSTLPDNTKAVCVPVEIKVAP